MHKVNGNGAPIPALGFGTWELRDAQARHMVEAALEIGYRHIDTAQMYGNEAEVGAALRASGLKRDELFVTTKIWPDRFRSGDLQRSVVESLEKLQLDAVDLLLLHWPNPDVPLPETMVALNDCAERGWARHIGVSNFTAAMLVEAMRLSSHPLATNQVEYHPFLSQRTVLEACRTNGMALTAYCPLARGRVFEDPTLARIAQRHGKTAGQVALRWLVQQEGVVAIPRSSRVEHARANFQIFDFSLSEPEMVEIAALGKPEGRIVAVGGSVPAWDPT
ncbi:aldo/keto reductase [Benzoatithermus flavus]|uniref:Aldo/keto reductase n=1 Tax=Benzoatithermus flavus TaxID=3108223 RepID=A0ABU8XTN5_9PROT